MAGRGGNKRSRRGDAKYNPAKREESHQNVDESSPVIKAFRCFQSELDSRHDRHERILKLGRDVTIESKRTIFLLHRTIGGKDKEAILKEAGEKLEEIRQSNWRKIAAELHGQDPYKFLRAFSPGLQEYIEAVSFYQYINNGTMITQDDVEKQLVFIKKPAKEEMDPTEPEQMVPSDKNKPSGSEQDSSTSPEEKPPDQEPSTEPIEVSVYVPPVEYVLGLADLSGELMRMAINSVAGGNLELPLKICGFLRVMHDAFVSFGNSHRDLPKKVWTLKQSMKKVENVCYTLQVRGSEVPKHMLVDVISSQSKGEAFEPDDSNII